ncbi:MAG TPA: hypothetical protein VGB16_06450 [candidate division Zixibacteria bacterium]
MNLERADKIEALKGSVDELCHKIINQEVTSEQATLEMDRVRVEAENLVPDEMDKFDMIYENRFKRLIQQFLSNA